MYRREVILKILDILEREGKFLVETTVNHAEYTERLKYYYKDKKTMLNHSKAMKDKGWLIEDYKDSVEFMYTGLSYLSSHKLYVLEMEKSL